MMWAGCSTHESGTPRSALGTSGNESKWRGTRPTPVRVCIRLQVVDIDVNSALFPPPQPCLPQSIRLRDA
jgi:hypothetical protein